MKHKRALILFAVAVAALGAALIFLQTPSVQTAATLPGVQDTRAVTADAPPCAGLTGQELERCRLETWAKTQPGSYEKGPRGNDIESSATGARAARGSGIEGVTSGGTTTAPPR